MDDLSKIQEVLDRTVQQFKAGLSDIASEVMIGHQRLESRLAHQERVISQMRGEIESLTMRQGTSSNNVPGRTANPLFFHSTARQGRDASISMRHLREFDEHSNISGHSSGTRNIPPNTPSVSLIDLLEPTKEPCVLTNNMYFSTPQVPQAQLVDLPVTSTPVQQKSSPTIKLRVDKYDGKSSLEDYLLQFSMIAQAQNWSLPQQANVLIASLRGEALAVLSEIPPAFRGDPGRLIRALKERFGKEHLTDLAYINLKARRQGPREEINAYAQDIRKLSRVAFKGCTPETLDHLAVRQFIDGLADLELQDLVRLTDPRTMEAAVVAAMKYAAARQANRASRGTLRSGEVVDLAENQQQECDSDSPNSTDGEAAEEGEIKEKKSPICRGIKLLRANAASTSVTGRGMLVRGLVNGEKMDIVVDTGANVSLIHPRVVEAMKPAVQMKKSSHNLSTITGGTAPILGELEVDLTLGEHPFSMIMHVAEISDEVILGLDFLQQHGAALDLVSGMLKLTKRPRRSRRVTRGCRGSGSLRRHNSSNSACRKKVTPTESDARVPLKVAWEMVTSQHEKGGICTLQIQRNH